MPYTASSYDFNYTVVYPTVILTFLVSSGIQASSDTLTSQGPITSEQQTYNLLQAKTLLANKEVHVQLDGLPVLPVVAITPAATSSNAGVPWLVIVLLIMAAILSVTGVVYRSVSRQATSMYGKNGPQGKQRPKQQVQTESGTKSRRHWLFWLGCIFCIMLVGWTVLSLLSGFLQHKRDDLFYGTPRTFQTDAIVGHNGRVSHFVAVNLDGYIEIFETQRGHPEAA